jgi:hypothetical protein
MARTHPFAEDDARPKPHASEGVTQTRKTGSPTRQGKIDDSWPGHARTARPGCPPADAADHSRCRWAGHPPCSAPGRGSSTAAIWLSAVRPVASGRDRGNRQTCRIRRDNRDAGLPSAARHLRRGRAPFAALSRLHRVAAVWKHRQAVTTIATARVCGGREQDWPCRPSRPPMACRPAGMAGPKCFRSLHASRKLEGRGQGPGNR